MRVLVDTSAWLALEDHQESRHARAAACWASLVGQGHRFLLSTWILGETLTLLSRRAGSERACILGRRLLDSLQIEMVRSDPILESQAMLVMRSRRDPGFSFADAASWVIVREYAVDAVFAFDRHLRIPGIRLLPEDEAPSVREPTARYRAGGTPRRMRRT